MNSRRYRFKGHESFILRDGWVTKALFAVNEAPGLFRECAGADELGVGTNMAKAIRYWMRAAGLTADGGKGTVGLSPLGRMILEQDAYLERRFTLWLLHLNTARNLQEASSWYLFFNCYEQEEFDRERLVGGMEELASVRLGLSDFSRRSLQDDCDAIIQMYARKNPAGADPEEKKVSPFYRLGLLREHDGILRREQPDLGGLDALAVLDAVQGCLDRHADYYSAGVDRLLTAERSPGKLLHLKRSFLMNYLEELERGGYLTVNRTAGLDMVYLDRICSQTELAERYYAERERRR